MKSNIIIRRDKSIWPAAHLVNSGQRTTQSLSISVHLIPFSLSVQPTARLVNFWVNRSQLSLMSLCAINGLLLRLLLMLFITTLLIFYYFLQHSTDLKITHLSDQKPTETFTIVLRVVWFQWFYGLG